MCGMTDCSSVQSNAAPSHSAFAPSLTHGLDVCQGMGAPAKHDSARDAESVTVHHD
jgi:hypothetical protein